MRIPRGELEARIPHKNTQLDIGGWLCDCWCHALAVPHTARWCNRLALPPSRSLGRNDYRRLHEASWRLVFPLSIPQSRIIHSSSYTAIAGPRREGVQPQSIPTVASTFSAQSYCWYGQVGAQRVEVADCPERCMHRSDGLDSIEPSLQHGFQLDPLLHRFEDRTRHSSHLRALHDPHLDQVVERPWED